MQVQSIQATNNCRKPCFKAHFVHDSKGLFSSLWTNASKDTGLELEINKLVTKKPDHALELIVFTNDAYKVLNHFNGKVQRYYIGKYSSTPGYNLYSVIRQINEDEKLFEDYEYHNMSEGFRFLTGQEKQKPVKI